VAALKQTLRLFGIEMPKLAANLSFLFQEVSFLDRFGTAAAAGFTGVEFLFPYDFAVGSDVSSGIEQHTKVPWIQSASIGNVV
jgi:hydroxypyruvate isomerase